jgi:adiponectin receptor
MGWDIEGSTLRDALVSAGVARLAWKWWLSRQESPAKTSHVTTADEVPGWLKEDSPDIAGGYRKPCSPAACLCSCGCCHNETFNIWSHYVPAIWFLRSAARNQKLPRYVALAAGSLFAISAAAHCLSSGGERTNEIMFRLDRAAIASYFCVFSTVLGMQHFTARNEPRLQRLFVAASVALGMLSSGTLFLGNSFPPWLKVLILSVQSLFGTIVPIRELLTTPSSYNRMLVLTYLPLSLGCGGIGGLCFASRFPEAWGLAPRGTFDFAGHGHNLMHVFVALAAFFGYRGQTLWQNSLDCMQARAARVAVAAAKLG